MIKYLNKISSFIDQLVVSGGNFLTISISAHLLMVSEQGKVVYAFSTYLGLLILNFSTIFQAAAVRAPGLDRELYSISLARMQIVQALLLAVISSLSWYLAGEWVDWSPSLHELLLLFIYLLLQQITDFDRRASYIFMDDDRALFSSLIVYPPRVLAILYFAPRSAEGVLVILVLTAIFPAVFVLAASFSKLVGYKSTYTQIIAHIFYSKSFIVSAPLNWISNYLPVFMLGIFSGRDSVALLVTIRNLSSIPNLFMERVETKLTAEWAHLSYRGERRLLSSKISKLIILGSVFWIIGYLLSIYHGEVIVAVFLGAAFAPHYHLLSIAWVAYGFYFLARLYGIKFRTLGDNRIELNATVLSLAISFIFSLILIPKYSEFGAAWVYVVASISALVGVVVRYRVKNV